MFKAIKNIFKASSKPEKFPTRKQNKALEKATAIATPRKVEPSPKFTPINVVTPSQSISGKFDYYSPTWKYLSHYIEARIIKLHTKNENATITMDRTQLIRGQLKELKALLKHTNQLAGIEPAPPTKSSLDIRSTDRGNFYE